MSTTTNTLLNPFQQLQNKLLHFIKWFPNQAKRSVGYHELITLCAWTCWSCWNVKYTVNNDTFWLRYIWMFISLELKLFNLTLMSICIFSMCGEVWPWCRWRYKWTEGTEKSKDDIYNNTVNEVMNFHWGAFRSKTPLQSLWITLPLYTGYIKSCFGWVK